MKKFALALTLSAAFAFALGTAVAHEGHDHDTAKSAVKNSAIAVDSAKDCCKKGHGEHKDAKADSACCKKHKEGEKQACCKKHEGKTGAAKPHHGTSACCKKAGTAEASACCKKHDAGMEQACCKKGAEKKS